MSRISRIEKITYYLITFFMILFMFTTITYNIWPTMNKIIGAIILLLIIAIYIFHLRKSDLLILMLISIIFIVSISYSSYDLSINISDGIYFSTTVLILWKITDNYVINNFLSSLNKIRKVIFIFVILSVTIIFLGLFFRNCYQEVWGSKYYICFSYSPHTFCCASCSLMIIMLFYFKNMKYDLVKILLFGFISYAVFQSGARTYIIPLIILWLLLFYKCIFHKNYIYLLIPIIITLFILVFSDTNMINKFLYTENNQYISSDSFVSFSSGRFEFWIIDLKEFFSYNDLPSILFGRGFDYIYYVNSTYYNLPIWAHNDFINVLVCNGIIGLTFYLFILVYLFKSIYNVNKKLTLFAAIYLLFVAFFNGLFEYQHFLYGFVFLYFFAYSNPCGDFYLEENKLCYIKQN